MITGPRTPKGRFALAVRRFPNAPVWRSISYGRGYCTVGRLLVPLGLSPDDPASLQRLLVDLDAPPPVRGLVHAVTGPIDNWSVGIDTGSPRQGLRIYAEASDDQLSVVGGEKARVVGVKWSNFSGEPLVTLYRLAEDAQPTPRGWAAEIEGEVTSLLAGATKRLLVREPTTLRASVDTAVDRHLLGDAAPVLLAVAERLTADAQRLAGLLDDDAEAVMHRLAFGADSLGEAFVTAYFRRGEEVVSTAV